MSKTNQYQIIQLIPFPIFIENHQFRMIIPTYNTLLFNVKNSIPIEIDHCKLVTPDTYFCNQNNHFKIPNNKLCETQLLSFTENQTCTPYLFDLIDIKISQINSATWLITSPSKTILDCALL